MKLEYRLDDDVIISTDVDDDSIEQFIKYFRELKDYLKDNNLLSTSHEPAEKKKAKASKGPATQKQIDCLKRNGIAFDDGITKGEAYDLLNAFFGRQ